MTLGERAADGEPDSEAVRPGGVEGLEDPFALLRRKPRPAVLHHQTDTRTGARPAHPAGCCARPPHPAALCASRAGRPPGAVQRRHPHPAVVRAFDRVEGIAQQVQQDLLDVHAVRAHRRESGLVLDLDANASPPPLVVHEREHLFDRLAEAEGLASALVLSHETAQPGEDLAGAGPLLGDPAERVLDQRGLRTPATHHAQASVGKAHDRRQRLVHLVHDPGAHLAELQQPRGVGRAFQPQPRPLLHLPALGEVADDTGEQPPAGKPHLAHREVDGEDAAVLALRFDLAADADDPRLAGAQVAGDVAIVLLAPGRGHEHRDVAPEQLAARVPEHPLGGRVDRLDLAGRLDGDDRVDGGMEDRAQALLVLGGSRFVGHDRAGGSGRAV